MSLSEEEKDLISNLVRENKINNFICLTEKNALLINEDKITILGEEKCLVISNGVNKYLSPKEAIPKIL